jgi:type II secretory pathway component GspD/PulD (secretin)
MRVVILNVRLTSDENAGIDWSRFNFGWKAQMQGTPFGNLNDSNSSGTSPSGSGSVLASAGRSYVEGYGAIFSPVGANFLAQTGRFTLSALLNFISEYGKSDIIQNVFVQTLSGREGKIDVLTETPYVSSVAVAALSSNAAATQSAASTDKAKSGVQLRLQPVYSKAAQTLSLRLYVGVFGVTRFLDLSAGALGSFTQPETTVKTLDTFIRMKPDQTAVLGGLIYDATSGGTRGLPGDSLLTRSVNSRTQKEELVIVLKPTVFEFEAM